MSVNTSAMEMPMQMKWRWGRWVELAVDWWAGARWERKDRLLLTWARGFETRQKHTHTHTHTHMQTHWAEIGLVGVKPPTRLSGKENESEGKEGEGRNDRGRRDGMQWPSVISPCEETCFTERKEAQRGTATC